MDLLRNENSIKLMLKKVIKFFRKPGLFVVRLYWRIFRPKTQGVKIILTHQNHVLLVRHTYGYKWTFPGGGLKKEEDKINAIKREIIEELKISLANISFLGFFVSTHEYKNDTIFVYTTEVPSRIFKIDNLEIDEARWFPINEMPGLGPIATQIFSLYKK
jgi:8-oxo-dGTP pyrophosphatase MutT (NUDIX family)